MTDAVAREVMEHATRFVGMKPDGPLRRCMILHGAGGLVREIGGEVGIQPNAVRAYLSRGWRRLAAHHWTPHELAQLAEVATAAMLRTSARAYDEREHAEGLVAAAANSRRYTRPTPTYDANGRLVGGRDPQVSVDDVLRILRGWDGMRRIF